tara:strand:- start:1895 stop:5485 length:3591 start_codon:yes stop_codon:yes gene_type:complete
MGKKVLKSLFDLEFDSRLFVEASAGTGKTYTIVGLFLRLLIEKGLKVDQILVMTFTKKATAELRERIFARLRDTLHYLNTGKTDDSAFMSDLERVITGLEREKLIDHLRDSIRNFDESQIFTIHSFCQKILMEEALIAGTPFEVEITQQDDLLLEAAEDEWRLFMAEHQSTDPGRYYIHQLMGLASTPAELVQELKPLFSRSYAEIEGGGHSDPIRYLNKVLDLQKEMKDNWFAIKEEVRLEFSNCDLKGYTENGIDKWFSEMDQAVGQNLFEKIDFTNFKRFTSSYQSDPSYMSKNGIKIPEHPFFDLCQEYSDHISEMSRIKSNLIEGFYEAIHQKRERLSDDSNALTFDDLLQKVSSALNDPQHGKGLASAILKKVPYALVDEFQDTDPVQYQIFDAIYPKTGSENGLLMIGDPKQAIYAFRGADIYTYLKARNMCNGAEYALQKNYRSSKELIEAVNSLFKGDHNPFLEKDIPFYPSEAGVSEHSNGLLIHGEQPKALQLSLSNNFYTNKEDALSFSIGETVSHIVNLLNLSKKGKATIENRELRAADICVLVDSHRDASKIKHALKSAGVGAVTYSKDKVFESFEAVRLNLALLAILEPHNRRWVHATLLNGFFGLSLSLIEEIQKDETNFQAFVEELQELNTIWHRSGFYAMFRAMLYHEKRLANLAKLEFSERILTNLLQLADICSKAETEGQLSPQELISWVHRQMTDPDQDEEKTLLLESDQNLVKISTIHSSKGLEFPIVFLPTPWAGLSTSRVNSLFKIYNDSERDQTVINIDQSESEERREAAIKSKFESLADEVRKFYVAVTRAKYQCTLCWTSYKTSHLSGMGAAILGSEKIWDLVKDSKNSISENDDLNQHFFIDHFNRLAEQHPRLIGLNVKIGGDTGKNSFKMDPDPDDKLQVKIYNGRQDLPVQRKLDSFSSLTHHKSEAGVPDYDQMIQSYSESLDEIKPLIEPLDIFSFPRGATAGTAIHKLFELEGFDFTTASEKDLTDDIIEVLEFYRIDSKWAPVMKNMMGNCTHSVISDLQLNRVSRENQLREMEFHFPSSENSPEDLFKTIRNGESGSAPLPMNQRGYMTGFIDLIVQQGGKFYILDYKSNYLGDNRDDYGKEQLDQAMLGAGYDLQAYIYTVALVKYLRKRVPNFDYDRDVGGVAYLFVRGMEKGSENGVWFHKPDCEKVAELEKKLGRE